MKKVTGRNKHTPVKKYAYIIYQFWLINPPPPPSGIPIQ